jgi:hypothetical protein
MLDLERHQPRLDGAEYARRHTHVAPGRDDDTPIMCGAGKKAGKLVVPGAAGWLEIETAPRVLDVVKEGGSVLSSRSCCGPFRIGFDDMPGFSARNSS